MKCLRFLSMEGSGRFVSTITIRQKYRKQTQEWISVEFYIRCTHKEDQTIMNQTNNKRHEIQAHINNYSLNLPSLFLDMQLSRSHSVTDVTDFLPLTL